MTAAKLRTDVADDVEAFLELNRNPYAGSNLITNAVTTPNGERLWFTHKTTFNMGRMRTYRTLMHPGELKSRTHKSVAQNVGSVYLSTNFPS